MNSKFAKNRSLVLVLSFVLSSLFPASASALSLKQFSDICSSSSAECSDQPIIQAYVGGALDLLATLEEKTEYLNRVYCRDTKILFDIPVIIDFMLHDAKQHPSDNAMLALISYFEVHGGCSK